MCNDSYRDFLFFHRAQLEYLDIPPRFWETLYHKCSKTIFDAGNVFSFEVVENEEFYNRERDSHTNIVCENPISWKVSVISDGISSEDGTKLYLVDHAYTYTLQTVARDLLEDGNLRNRLISLMNMPKSDEKKEIVVNDMLKEMWRFCQPYVYGTTEFNGDSWTVWYIMDELGVRIQHSHHPTFRAIPFFYSRDRLAYTVLYPLKDVIYGDEVTRNFVEGLYRDDLSYKAAMLPWKHCSFIHVDCCLTEPPVDFIQSGRMAESLPNKVIDKTAIIRPCGKLKVWCDYSVIRKNLSHPKFEFVDMESEADVLWLSYHFKEYRDLSAYPHKYVNQFPLEHIVTSKDLLAVACRRTIVDDFLDVNTLETYPPWLPTTYNLNTELCKFISYFQQRENKGLENYWIIKPWNRARGADMQITENLNSIVRLSSAGPKVACKYITDPVLFPVKSVGLVKMDIRYIIVLKSVRPLELYAYRNFWLRFSNKPFSLDSFDDYEKHFTVMNYNGFNLKQMYCTEFIAKFEDYYSDLKWIDIE